MPTTPPPTTAQTQQKQAARQAEEAAAVAAVGSVLLTATSAGAGIVVLHQLTRLPDLPEAALLAALAVVMGHPPGQTGFYGPATMTTERLNLQRRAQFVLAAARRIGADLKAARSRGQGLAATLADSVDRERRYYGQHLQALWNRSQAGAQADSAAMTYGLLLGWHAKADAKTSRECLAANGRNFYADHMPFIGYPGAVHPHCRCEPGPPFPGARLVPSYGLVPARRYRRAA